MLNQEFSISQSLYRYNIHIRSGFHVLTDSSSLDEPFHNCDIPKIMDNSMLLLQNTSHVLQLCILAYSKTCHIYYPSLLFLLWNFLFYKTIKLFKKSGINVGNIKKYDELTYKDDNLPLINETS